MVQKIVEKNEIINFGGEIIKIEPYHKTPFFFTNLKKYNLDQKYFFQNCHFFILGQKMTSKLKFDLKICTKKAFLKIGAPEKMFSGPHRTLESFLNGFPILWFNISIGGHGEHWWTKIQKWFWKKICFRNLSNFLSFLHSGFQS